MPSRSRPLVLALALGVVLAGRGQAPSPAPASLPASFAWTRAAIAEAWTSTDGSAWERVEDQVSVSGASLAGATFTGDAPVVVGTSGYPDNDQASSWFEGR